MVDKDDWRLRGQEEYLNNAVLYYIPFKPFSEQWDHEHCDFCWATFSLGTDDLKEGYCTKPQNERRAVWICSECYEDFKEMFNWTKGE